MRNRLSGGHGAKRLALLLAVLAFGLAMIAAGCGGDDDEAAGTTEAAPAETEPADTGAPAETEPADTGAAGGGGALESLKLAILSDCEGAFAAFYEPDIGGAQAAFAQFAGGQPSGENPSDGMTGIEVAGLPIEIVGYGCADDTAETALAETRRLMEQLDADVLIGPLSGDEGIAVAQYAKEHPDKTFINGTSGAQDTTLKVRAPNFFRFNSDGAQWSAGLGTYAKDVLGWETAAVVGDDYSFPYTSVAGFVAEFCAAGGDVTARVWPPLGETDYSSYVSQIPDDVDGVFVAVGGAGTAPFFEAYKSLKGEIDPNKIMGNLFVSDPVFLQEYGENVIGIVSAVPTAADSTDPKAVEYNRIIDETYPSIAGTGPSVFTYNYYNAAWALIQALEAIGGQVDADQANLQAALAEVALDAAYGPIELDENRQAITDNYVIQNVELPDGTVGTKTIAKASNVDQSFGGVFTPDTPSVDRENPPCEELPSPPPWVGNLEEVNFAAGEATEE